MHFDYVSGQGLPKNAATVSSGELSSMLWQRCGLSMEPEGERKPSLAPEKQMMRLRMLAPLITVNSTQVATPSPSSPLARCVHAMVSVCLLHLLLQYAQQCSL